MTHPFPSSSSTSSASSALSHVPSSFPAPGSIAAATFTSASAHASSPSHASKSAVNALSAPSSSEPAAVATPPPPPSAPAASHPPTQQPPMATTSAVTATGSPSNSHSPKVLPYLFDDAQLDDVLVLVVDMLVKLTEHNDSLPLHPSALTRFHSRATPNITLSAYLRRIAKYTSIEKCCVLILLVYIDRVCERLEGFTICGLTVHRFICAAILCASKALCDAFNTNEHYAKVGGISLQEINLLEKEFLQIIDWRLICSGAVLQHYYASLVRSHSDYVLAEPTEAQLEGSKKRRSADLNGQSSGGNGSSSGSSASRNSSTSRDRPSRPTAGAGLTPAIGSSQHSSPFPISSTSASPFTSAGFNVVNGGLVAGNASTASGSGSSTSPLAPMQVDSDPPANTAPATASNRRRKDEQRTPPSPHGVNAHNSSTGVASGSSNNANGYGNGEGGAEPSTTNPPQYKNSGYYQDEAHKRTRFDHQPPPQQPPSGYQP